MKVYDPEGKKTVEDFRSPLLPVNLTLGRLRSMSEADGYVCLHPVSFPGFGLILIKGKLTNSGLLSGAEVTPPRCGSFALLYTLPRRTRPELSICISPPGTPPQSSRVVLGFISQACLVPGLVLLRRGVASWNSAIRYEIELLGLRHIQSPRGDDKAKL